MADAAPARPQDDNTTAVEVLAPLFGISIFFIVLNTIFLILRFVTVLFLRPKKLGIKWDDWMLIPAYLFTLGVCIIGLVMHYWETRGNPPGHVIFTDFGLLSHVLKCIFALLLLLVPAYAFTRYSILALYLRLFNGQIMRYLSWAMVVFISAQWISFTFATIFQCNPVSFYWDKTIGDGTCVDINRFNRSFTPVNIAADAIIFVLPFPAIWRTRMSKARKSGVTFILGLGSIALASSIVRAATLDFYTTTEISPFLSNTLVQWLVVEPSLYFITACLPAMHPLFRHLLPESYRHKVVQKIHSHGQNINIPLQKPRISMDRFKRSKGESTPQSASLPIIPGAESEGATHAEAAGGPLSVEQMENQVVQDGQSIPLRDVWQVEEGQGIMVTKEISVTEEEKIEDVFGF